MQSFYALSAILGALLIGAISPGPSFVLVARISIARSRRDGLAAALAMGVGGVILGSLALLGLRALLMQAAHPLAVSGLLAHTAALDEPYERLMEDCAQVLRTAAEAAGAALLQFAGRSADPFATPDRR